MLMKKLIFGILLTFILTQVEAYERSDAFIIRLYDKRIKILAPSQYDPKLNVIIENKTLTKTIAKLERTNGEILSYISIMPGKFTSLALKTKKGEVLYFVPISPPFQKVELIPGRKPYEIPPKR